MNVDRVFAGSVATNVVDGEVKHFSDSGSISGRIMQIPELTYHFRYVVLTIIDCQCGISFEVPDAFIFTGEQAGHKGKPSKMSLEQKKERKR